jgi:lipoate-protein ligase A
MVAFSFLELEGVSIYQQLQIDEALLRADDRNWCIINSSTPPAIVMGISGKVDALLHTERVNVPIVRRFSGGGTVVVDANTLFVSFICNKEQFSFPPFPEYIMQWSEEFYQKVFTSFPFALRENDYVINDKKFGGNAQSITKSRWAHHSTLLWDYSKKRMEMLKLPDKRPNYRGEREHDAFLCTLNEHFHDKKNVLDSIKEQLNRLFAVEQQSIENVEKVLSKDYRRSTRLLKPTIVT